MEATERYESLEQARNAAIKWLEMRGAVFGPHYRVAIGRLGSLAGKEAGVSSSGKPFWRLRLDFDEKKGPHYNAEIDLRSQLGIDQGPTYEKCAFTFPGDAGLVARLALKRNPR
jgi:hypothetical protein